MKSLPNKLVNNYLSKSKILLIPSYFESASIIILEALKCGCKVITSSNVGLHYLLPKKYLCNDVYDINDWINNINNILSVDEIYYNIPSYENINLSTDVFELFPKEKEKSKKVWTREMLLKELDKFNNHKTITL